MLKQKITFYCFCIFFFFFNSLFSQYYTKNFYSLFGKKDVGFNCVAQDKNEYLWIGTNEGLIKFDGSKTEIFKKENGISDPKITAVYVDESQTVWIGTES